jgi:hypothetical protein
MNRKMGTKDPEVSRNSWAGLNGRQLTAHI